MNRLPDPSGDTEQDGEQPLRPVSKSFWSFFALGMLFCILGAGNMIIGTVRSARYQGLLNELEDSLKPDSEHTLLEGSSEFDLLDTEDAVRAEPGPLEDLKSAKESEYLSLSQRYDYYRFCVVGGKYFLAFGGCLLLGALVLAKLPLSANSRQSS